MKIGTAQYNLKTLKKQDIKSLTKLCICTVLSNAGVRPSSA